MAHRLCLPWFSHPGRRNSRLFASRARAKHVCDVKELCVIVPDWPAEPQEKSLPIDRFSPGNRQRWAEHEQYVWNHVVWAITDLLLLGWRVVHAAADVPPADVGAA